MVTKGKICLVFSAIIYGIAPLLAKIAYQGGMNEITLTFLRTFLALPLLFILMFQRKQSFLLTIKEFNKLVDCFECGNWIRVINDEDEIYKLRLVDYEIDFDNLDNISVTLSDVIRTIDGLAPIREILIKSSDIINNYNYIYSITYYFETRIKNKGKLKK